MTKILPADYNRLMNKNQKASLKKLDQNEIKLKRVLNLTLDKIQL